jgi:hypothetical protein
VIFTPFILNNGSSPDALLEQPIDILLTLSLADLKTRFIDPERSLIRYHEIRNSGEYKKYQGLARRLQSFDLLSLKDRKQRLAFWINIYNAAVIHGVIELGLTRSVREVFKFFDRVTYTIGRLRFSLNDMEHGILRGNRRPPYGWFRPFGEKDPRNKFIVSPMDPRIHFALVCGARSCPPISFYEAGQVEDQLQLAAMSFINSAQVRLFPKEKALLISRIFKWYKSDFGGNDRALIDTILSFLDEGEEKNFLKENRDRIHLKYQPYDWSLNQ